jgi:hypothetical protein
MNQITQIRSSIDVAQPELMLTSKFVFLILDFLGKGHQEKHPGDIVRNYNNLQRVGKVQFMHVTHTLQSSAA